MPAVISEPMTASLERLARGHRTFFPHQPHPPDMAIVAVHARPLSEIAEVELRFVADTARVFVKVHRHAQRPAAAVRAKARLEFDTLADLHDKFHAIPGCAVARPITFFPEQSAVVTEAVDGGNLQALVRRYARVWSNRARAAAIRRYCHASGVWLRHFQELTAEPRHVLVPTDEIESQVADDLARCVALGLDRGTADRMRAFLRAQASAVAGHPTRAVGKHPDFQPDNVLASEARITVVDFTSFHHGPRYSDPARFVSALRLLGRHPLASERRLRSFAGAFLDGYGVARGPAFTLYVLRFVLRSTRTAAERGRHGAKPRLARHFALAFFRRWAADVLRAGDGLVQP